jgi:hypothetical protein
MASPRSPRRRTEPGRNPKQSEDRTQGNRIKDPDDWVTGQEPMTEAQASYLKTLSEQAHEPDAFDPTLDKADASKRIDELKSERDGR